MKVGPIVLPCVVAGRLSKDDTVLLKISAKARPSSWLVPVTGPGAKPLHFTIKGSGGGASACTFKPSWDIAPSENFTTFPVYYE